MARIPDTELERIKREVSLLELVRASGVELKRHGGEWIGLCPFHRDTNPSLVITPAKHLWHCLGACQAGGSVIDWVMRREGVSFRRAGEHLRTALPGGSGPGLVLEATLDGELLGWLGGGLPWSLAACHADRFEVVLSSGFRPTVESIPGDLAGWRLESDLDAISPERQAGLGTGDDEACGTARAAQIRGDLEQERRILVHRGQQVRARAAVVEAENAALRHDR